MKKLFLDKNVDRIQDKKTQLSHMQPLSSLTPASHHSISTFIKNKFSQRNHCKSRFLKIQKEEPRVQSWGAHQLQQKNQNLPRMNSHFAICDFHTLDMNHKSKEKWLQKKDSATSTSIRVESNSNLSSKTSNLKLARRMRRVRGLFADNNTFSVKEAVVDNPSQLLIMPRSRPKLVQHGSLCEQQLANKRSKFDSQFMSKKSVLLSSAQVQAAVPSQSQVTEDICRLQSSKLNSGLEDTLQRGLQPNIPVLDDSGSLYESVYQ